MNSGGLSASGREAAVNTVGYRRPGVWWAFRSIISSPSSTVGQMLMIIYAWRATNATSTYECNIYKGSNVAALDPLTQEATRLYDPRQQTWNDHFEINADATLTGMTPEGRATIIVLRMNDEERVQQRLGEMMSGDYPCQKD